MLIMYLQETVTKVQNLLIINNRSVNNTKLQKVELPLQTYGISFITKKETKLPRIKIQFNTLLLHKLNLKWKRKEKEMSGTHIK